MGRLRDGGCAVADLAKRIQPDEERLLRQVADLVLAQHRIYFVRNDELK